MNFNVQVKIRTRTLWSLDTQPTCHYISLNGFQKKFLYQHNCLNTLKCVKLSSTLKKRRNSNYYWHSGWLLH